MVGRGGKHQNAKQAVEVWVIVPAGLVEQEDIAVRDKEASAAQLKMVTNSNTKGPCTVVWLAGVTG